MLILPNLIWQYGNNFPVIHHMKELSARQLVNVNRWGFLTDQVLFFIGSLPIILSGLYALFFYPPFKKYRFFFWNLCFTLLVFTYLKAKSYYAIGLYPIYIAIGSAYLGEVLQTGWLIYLRPFLLAIPILLFIPMYQVVFPNRSPEYIIQHPQLYRTLGLLRWEDGKDHPLPQDFADMLGWKDLARQVDSIYAKMEDPEHTLILCDNYGQAGAIDYYAQNKKIRAVAFNSDYINWFNLNIKYDHLIRIKSVEDNDKETSATGQYFQTGYVAGGISNPYAREYGTTIYVFKNAKIDIRGRIKEEIERYK